MKRALAWLFAAAWLAALTLALPRGSGFAAGAPSAPSASVVAARDAGQALVRSAPVISIAAPAADPTPPAVAPRRSPSVERTQCRELEASTLAVFGAGVRVVRWQRHVPRMDSGEPPRQGDVSS